jgi:hypothetical protein
MRGPQGLPGIHGCSGLKSVEPQKSPGCLRVPGLFFLLSEVRVIVVFSHSFTANRGEARRALVGWVGMSEADLLPISRIHGGEGGVLCGLACARARSRQSSWRQATRQDQRAYSLTPS